MMMHRRSAAGRVLAVAVAIALVATGCGGDDDPAVERPDETGASASATTDEPTTEAGAATSETLRIGLVAPSAENDMAWTQAMFDSLNRVGAERDVEIAFQGGLVMVDAAAAAIRGYAEDGYDLVIAHGIQFSGPLPEIADDFPDVSFAIGTSTDFFGRQNVYAYSVDAEQGGYVNGVMAAQLTKTNVIGVVGPVPAGDAQRYIDGFVSGVAAQNPDVDVAVNYIESFSDVVLASEAATAHVANDADVLTGSAQMVSGATAVAAEQGIPWFGTQSNQEGFGPDVVVASQVYHWEVVLNRMFDQVGAGILGGEAFVMSFADGGLEMEYNAGYPLDPDIRASADAAVARIADGSLVVSPHD